MASTQQRRPTPHITTPSSNHLDNISTLDVQGHLTTAPHISLTSTLSTPSLQEPRTPPPTLATPMTAERDKNTKPDIITSRSSGYFPTQSVQPASSPTDSTGGLLSPVVSPVSSPTPKEGDTFESINSSMYLTPPSRRGDKDYPPYKAAIPSLDNHLAALFKKDRKRFPNQKCRRRNRARHRCGRQRIHKTQDPELDWWTAQCQAAPTAPKGSRYLCDSIRALDVLGTNRKRIFELGATAGLKQSKGFPDIARRWSSVEVRTHHLSFKSEQHPHPKDTPLTASSKPGNISRHLTSPGQRYRSITYPQDAAGHEMIRTIREKLISRKVSTCQNETPAVITLRGATDATRAPKLISFGLLQENESGESSPTKEPGSAGQEDLDAYWVTRSDVDNITAFLEASLRRLVRKRLDDDERHLSTATYRIVEKHPSSTQPTSRGKKSPKVTSKGVVLELGLPARTAITVAEAQRQFTTTKSPACLNLSPATIRPRDKSSTVWKRPKNSVHEILWEDWKASQGKEPLADIEQLETAGFVDCSSHSNAGSPSGIVPRPPLIKSRVTVSRPIKADAATEQLGATKMWSWSHQDCPNSRRPAVSAPSSNSSNSASTTIRHILPSSPVPKFQADQTSHLYTPSPSTLEDVVSFPPLPVRENTIDWWSPLPSLSTRPTDLSTYSQNLYDLGLDITCSTPCHLLCRPCPPPRSPVQISPNTSFVSLASYRLPLSPFYSPTRSRNASTITLRPSSNNSTSNSITTPHPSIVKSHPRTHARLSASSTLGCSIGVSSGERRRSSALTVATPIKLLRRVMTVDNKPERDSPMVKNRGPSVCPPPGRRSLEGEEGEEEVGSEDCEEGKEDEEGDGKGEGKEEEEEQEDDHEGANGNAMQNNETEEGEVNGTRVDEGDGAGKGKEPEHEDSTQTMDLEESKCKGLADYKALIDAVSLPLPVKDRVGLYEKLTETRQTEVREGRGSCLSIDGPEVRLNTCDNCRSPKR